MNPLRGIALKLLSVALFAVMVACVKEARETVPSGETVFFRSFFALIPVLIWAASTGQIRKAVTTSNIRGHFWRGAVGASAMMLSFAALGFIPLPELTAIGFSAPLITTILAVFLLGEKVHIHRWSAVFVGLIGVVVMIWPSLTGFGNGAAAEHTLGVLLGLASAGLMALAVVHVRWLTRTENTMAIVFWFHISCSVVALASLPFGWVVPDIDILILMIASGIFGGLAQILLTISYRMADASTLSPFDYSMMLYSLLTAYLLFGEVPSVQVLVGAAIVIGAGLYILMRERQLGVARPAPLRRNTP
ncbi:DMT family transporter [Rhodobacteraceae bacterium NNCM2]|nr:DMT family transporter [Coraliihabitans acroporae]